MSGGGLSRRAMLAAGLAVSFAGGARAAAPLRSATLDWAILETLLAIGQPPVAAAELVQFRAIAVEPPVPADVADLGLRGLPNLETLLFARPDIIFNSNYYAALEPLLATIAPVESFTLYQPGIAPYDAVVAMTRALGVRLSAQVAAEAYLARAEAGFVALRSRLGTVERPVLPLNFGDSRHFRAFGFDSMIGQGLLQLGLTNAWSGPTSYSATAPVGLERLAQETDAWITVIGPTPPDVASVLAGSAFWHALPAVAAGRVLWLGPVDPFGALPSALRFARLLTEALEQAGSARHG